MRLFIFAASLRKDSFNKKLAVLIGAKLEALGAEVDHADFREFDMPLYDGDLEASDGLPAGTQALADRIAAADGTIIVSPEYNFGVPGPLKNAIDWLSRIRPYPTVGKTGFLASAAPSLVGGARGIIALRPALSFMGMWLSGDSFSLAQAGQAFDENGGIEDEALDKLLDGMLARFVKVTGALQAD
jgi:NAD(P)H-dependent FMN reductase